MRLVLLLVLVASVAHGKYTELINSTSNELERISIVADRDLNEAKKMIEDSEILFRNLKNRHALSKLRLHYDKILGNKGLAINWWDSAHFPVMSANHRRELGLEKSLPNTIAIAKKYRVNLTPYSFLKRARVKPDEIVTIWNEYITRLDHIDTEWLQLFNLYFAKIAKSKNRKAFVEAMASPYYEGINDWLSSIGVKTKLVDISTIWKKEDIEALKAQVISGDMPLTESFAYRLKIALGVTEYNKFIDQYLKED